jgi:predicted transcriptional regulator
MADLLSDVKSKLQTTSMADVANTAGRAVDSVERGLRGAVDSGKKFIRTHTPESVKALYRDARGYTVRRPEGRRDVTGKR